MTTDKQKTANKANSQNSTGAKTTEGKAVVASNAIKHGLLSTKLILDGEAHGDYQALLSGLMTSLNPVGMLEAVLAEKIAVALWKQKRLVTAESAGIELGRTMKQGKSLKLIESAMGLSWDEKISKDELQPLTDDDLVQLKWCKAVEAEIDALAQVVLDNTDYAGLKQNALLTYKQLENEVAAEEMEMAYYITNHQESLSDWVFNLKDYCIKEAAKINRRGEVLHVAELAQAQLSAPINHELLGRYQTALDNELYRAIDALRKQQEWRSKGFIEAEAA